MLESAVYNRFAVFVSIALALALPKLPFSRFILQAVLMVLLYVNFLTIQPEWNRNADRFLFLYPFFVFVVYPILLMFLSPYMPDYLFTGLLIACITPTATASPVMSDIIRGKTSRLLGHVLMSNIISPLSYSILLLVFLHARSLSIPYMRIGYTVGILVLIPYASARLTARFHSRVKSAQMPLLKKGLFLLLVFVAASSASPSVRSLDTVSLFVIFLTSFSLALILYGTGFLLGSTDAERKTAALMFGHKNIGLSLLIAVTNFGADASLPLVLYIISHHILNGILIGIYGKQS